MNDEITTEFNKVMKKFKMPAEHIALEISDYSIYEKNSLVKSNLARLKKLGFLIAINGFGLDYSTMSTLDSKPIDIIKLDRKFFEREKESYMKVKLADLIVEFAKEKNKTVIAEGVENENMLQTAKDANIGIAQGYYFAKPMVSPDLNSYIQAGIWVKKDDFKQDVITKVPENVNVKEELPVKPKGLNEEKIVPPSEKKETDFRSESVREEPVIMTGTPVNVDIPKPEADKFNSRLEPDRIQTIAGQPKTIPAGNNQNRKDNSGSLSEKPKEDNKDKDTIILKDLDDLM
jgi:hypothetical protein